MLLVVVGLPSLAPSFASFVWRLRIASFACIAVDIFAFEREGAWGSLSIGIIGLLFATFVGFAFAMACREFENLSRTKGVAHGFLWDECGEHLRP